jgi:hypothetical protein
VNRAASVGPISLTVRSEFGGDPRDRGLDERVLVSGLESAVSAWTIASALEPYEVKRMPRTARVQMACREEGEVLHAMTSAGKDEPIGIERFLPQRLPGFTRDWLYEYDATAS